MTMSIRAQIIMPIINEHFLPFDDTLYASGYIVASKITGEPLWLGCALNLEEVANVWNERARERSRRYRDDEEHREFVRTMGDAR